MNVNKAPQSVPRLPGPEMTLDALLEDASIKLLMERDGIAAHEITELFARLRAQRIARRWRQAA